MKATAHSARPGAAGRRIFGCAQRSAAIDPYGSPLKPGEPIVCPHVWLFIVVAVGAGVRSRPVRRNARPVQGDDAGRQPIVDPATRRAQRMSEMTALARRQEEIERADHPLNRIMDVSARPDALVIRQPTSISRAAWARR